MSDAIERASRYRGAEPEAQVGLEELIGALSSSDAYPRPVDAVRVLQTPVSVLFFAGDRVYKLKKPVKLPFLDYTDVEARRRYCENELILNRRTSPRIYLGVSTVTREADGRILVDGSGTVVDSLVEMVRLPADRMLDTLLEGGRIGEVELEHVGVVLARFHERAMTGPTVNRHGLAAAITRRTIDNIERLSRLADASAVSSPAIFEFLRERAVEFPRSHRALLERRLAEWRIREGHGDLHAGNICLVGDDVYVFDCVEFDRGLRCADIASDMASLAMDLDHRGHRWAADHLVEFYAELTSDSDFVPLVAFYKTYRALVRAKAELAIAGDEAADPEKRRGALLRSRRCVQLAVGYELPACLILTSGPPATGEPHVAEYVAGRFGASLLRSGASRGSACSDEPTDAPERRASEDLARGRSVVVDVSPFRRALRRPLLEAAAQLAVPCYLLQLDATEPVAGEPLEQELPADRVLVRSGTGSPEEHCQELQERMVRARSA